MGGFGSPEGDGFLIIRELEHEYSPSPQKDECLGLPVPPYWLLAAKRKGMPATFLLAAEDDSRVWIRNSEHQEAPWNSFIVPGSVAGLAAQDDLLLVAVENDHGNTLVEYELRDTLPVPTGRWCGISTGVNEIWGAKEEGDWMGWVGARLFRWRPGEPGPGEWLALSDAVTSVAPLRSALHGGIAILTRDGRLEYLKGERCGPKRTASGRG